MTATVTTAFWSMTINNPDETDLALVRNGYADYCRELIHTLEVGESGTTHIQAWVKLQRQQRMSFMRKLFPRGHFKPLTSAEYVLNTKMYAQKEDETTAGAHVHVFHDPMNTVESLVKKVVYRCIDYIHEFEPEKRVQQVVKLIQRKMVWEDYKFAKLFTNATYKAMWREYGDDMIVALREQYVREHTHVEEESSVVIDTTNGEESESVEGESGEGGSEVSEDDDYEECASEASEGSDEGGSDDSDEEDDSSESGE